MSYTTTIVIPEALIIPFKHLARMRNQSQSAMVADLVRELAKQWHPEGAECTICRLDKMPVRPTG